MDQHDADLYRRALGLKAEDDIPKSVEEAHASAQMYFHRLQGDTMRPIDVVHVLLAAGCREKKAINRGKRKVEEDELVGVAE